jgi:hypothetical protein
MKAAFRLWILYLRPLVHHFLCLIDLALPHYQSTSLCQGTPKIASSREDLGRKALHLGRLFPGWATVLAKALATPISLGRQGTLAVLKGLVVWALHQTCDRLEVLMTIISLVT